MRLVNPTILCLTLSVVVQVQSWTSSTGFLRRHTAPTTTVWSSAEDDEKDDGVVVPQASYGVSFMGGDPCGSKYNDDPFDATKAKKPGIPDDMKARIAALAEKKKRETAQRAEDEAN